MKATGIVRRIDDLGRVVIPKEIRRTMRIREGDPLEIYTDKDGEVIFKKYSPIGELSKFAGQICETMNKSTGHCCVVTDRDSIISVYGAQKRELLDKSISHELEDIMESRQIYQCPASVTTSGTAPGPNVSESPRIPLSDSNDKYCILIAAPIIAEGDVLGSIVFAGDDAAQCGEIEYKLAQTVAGFIGKQMEG